MEQEIKNIIKTSIPYLKEKNRVDNFKNVRLLELLGRTLGTEKLKFIVQDKLLLANILNSSSITPPKYVFDFIQELIGCNDDKTIFDPFLTISSTLIHLQAQRFKGTVVNETEFQTISTLFKDKSQDFKYGNAFTEISNINEKFDCVVSFPPFGLKTERANRTNKTLDFALSLLLECNKLIDTNGRIIFLISNSFLRDDKGKEALKKAGLFVEAVFAIPIGAFVPITNMSASLILVSKNVKQKTFVAEISQDLRTNQTILQNFKNQKKGKATQLGCFVDIVEFKSLNALISKKEMLELAKKIGYPPILLNVISLQINIIKGNNIDEVEPLTNSIYFPSAGNFPVVASLSEVKGSSLDYYQIQLNEAIANAIYVANYLNAPIGKKLKQSLEIGFGIPRIFRSQLENCVLYLPDINIQLELIEVDNKIEQYTLKLEELKRNLWKEPRFHTAIARDLKTFNQEDKLENWIDKLPFPISSILWHYYATDDNGKKIEHLFHFFEAFSEFLSMLILSALAQDKEFYNSERHKWISEDEKFHDWYLTASFGSWIFLTSGLSKAVREYLNDEERKDYCKNLFGNPNDDFLSMITNKQIFITLKAVLNLRNDWKGHGGVTNDEENNRRVRMLEHHLNKFRKYIGDAFDDTSMLSPTKCSFEDGIFTFNAKELIGARLPFKDVSVKSIIPLDSKKLYLSNIQNQKPLQLLPFIKYRENSKAIYFYSRIENKYVRWVSYHFENEAEINETPEKELLEVFDLLKL